MAGEGNETLVSGTGAIFPAIEPPYWSWRGSAGLVSGMSDAASPTVALEYFSRQ